MAFVRETGIRFPS